MNNSAIFPSDDWMKATMEKINSDEHYAQIAKKWEGDVRLVLEPDDRLHEPTWLYWDFWHGKCRDAYVEDQSSTKAPAFVLTAPYGNFVKVLSGEVGPMQALMSRMLKVRGSFAYFMRNVPTILAFVQECQAVTNSWL